MRRVLQDENADSFLMNQRFHVENISSKSIKP